MNPTTEERLARVEAFVNAHAGRAPSAAPTAPDAPADVAARLDALDARVETLAARLDRLMLALAGTIPPAPEGN